MKRFSTSLIILLIFVSLYVFCVCAYTFISGLNSINYFDNRIESKYVAFARNRRAVATAEQRRLYTSEEDHQELIAVKEKHDTWKDNIWFNVCCDVDEYLDSKFDCVKINGTKELVLQEKVRLLSESAVVDEDLNGSSINQERIVLKYNFKQNCPTDETVVITWPKEQPYPYYIAQKNGYLLELSDDRKTVVSSFSTSSFCLDAMKDQEKFYVALLCPCKEKVCVQKCCPKGFYYNTESSSCKMESEDGVESYKPTLGDGISYHLMYSAPQCRGPDRMIIDKNETLPLNILENGHLMAISKEIGVFDRKRYCVDIFSNGNTSYVNGFYCPNEAKIKLFTEKNPVLQRIGEADYSPGAGNSVNFGLFIMIICFLLQHVYVKI